MSSHFGQKSISTKLNITVAFFTASLKVTQTPEFFLLNVTPIIL